MKKLHLGCGWRNFGKDWVHIDAGDYPHLDSNDITNLPFEDNSVDIIYASHVLEYFDREEVSSLLKEWNRVLKQNGLLRIAVPDFESICNLYTKHQLKLETFLGPLYGKMPMGSNTIYHKTCYDFESLKRLLENYNYHNVKKYDWRNTEHHMFDDHSQAYLPHMDKENGTLISLNVETNKK
jgi:predicted SAM-dependent methyltransferase